MSQIRSNFSDDFTSSTRMTLDSLRESSLVQLEQYLNSNPYREYSMHKPYFPKTFLTAPSTHRSLALQNPSFVPFQELMESQKDPIILDRLAYKLRMKSDLNIDTLRETHVRRRRHRHHHSHQANSLHSNSSDAMSSIPPSVSTKSYARQPTSITVSTNTMKPLNNEDLNGIEGNAVRVGTIDDLIKQFRRAEFRVVRRPIEFLDNASTQLSSEISTNDRTTVTKSHLNQERPVKQPQALTEYRFNAPTFRSSPTTTYRDPMVHQGLIYQYRTRERNHPNDLPILPSRPLITSDHPRQRLNSLVIEERHPNSVASRDKRVQESREKSLIRTERQVCVCSKLTIVDPFNTSIDTSDSNLPQLHHYQPHHQSTPSINYLFPPVRPFGYLTKKTSSTTDELQQISSTPPPPVPTRRKKKRHGKKKLNKTANTSSDSLDKLGNDEIIDDEDNSQIFNETIKSMMSLDDLDEETLNKTIDMHLNINNTLNNIIQDHHETSFLS